MLTIKDSLQMNIPTVKAFLMRNFLSPVKKMAKNLHFCAKILFSGFPKGTSLHKTTSFDVLIVKIGAGVLAVGRRKNQKH